MKKSILILSLMLAATAVVSVAFKTATEQAALEGAVIAMPKGDSLSGVSVSAFRQGLPAKETTTDAKGRYQLQVEPGMYEVVFQKAGYETKRIVAVPITKDKTLVLDAVLAPSADLEASSTTVYAIHAVNKSVVAGRVEDRLSGSAPGAVMHERVASASYSVMSPPPPAAIPAAEPDMRAEPLEISAKGHVGRKLKDSPTTKPKESPAPKREALPTLTDVESAPAHEATKPVELPAPRAGLLTAGEWSDLHNWNRHWKDLLADGEISDHQKTYGFYPRYRYTALLQNQQGFPIINATVQLVDIGNTVLWETRTDNTGKAELWAHLFDASASAPKNPHIRLLSDGPSRDLGPAKPYSEGINLILLDQPCATPKNIDIVWAVDATGSMGDEIEYLKTELLDVIGRVKNSNPDLMVRMGSVFYRDMGDDYLVKHSALNADINKTVQYIRQQHAGGGGDFPEAVHSALEEALQRQRWSTDAVARICFLVLDASPHNEPEVLESLRNSIRAAAKQGIRIVPVSASGIQKDTEFLMKFFGLATNGTYVFLTDHSGIGGKHLEPTTDEYKVESLNNLLVRLITEYATVETCEGKSAIRFENADPQQQQQQPLTAQYYPNPAADQFWLDLSFDADKVTLYDSEGKAVRALSSLPQGRHAVPVGNLPPGFYTLRIWKGEQVQSGKVAVIR